jgi:hypothetical protein
MSVTSIRYRVAPSSSSRSIMTKSFRWQSKIFAVKSIGFLLAGMLCTSPAFSNAQSLDSVTITTFDGSTLTATIDAIDENGQLSGSQIPAGLNLSEIVSIETDKKPASPDTKATRVQLVIGGQLLIRNPKIAAETISFESPVGLSEIPLQSVRAILWNTAPAIEKQIVEPSADEDVAFVQTAGGLRAVSGIVESLDGEQLQINYKNESRKIGLNKITAIVMAELGLPEPSGLAATLNLTDGSTIVGVISELKAGTFTLKLTSNNTLEINANYLASVSIRSDRLLFLSDIEPIKAQQRTEFALQRPWQKDRSVEGHPLSFRNQETENVTKFNKGLGTQAFTELVFQNSDDFDRFQATVGIDAETRGRGDCQCVVRGDGIELWSGRVVGSGEPVELDLDISGMKKIALVVYPGNDFDLADHLNWVNARFVRTK